MGEVYRARDPKLRRDVAIKVLPAEVAADPDRLARFEREARAVATLSHPNIVAIHHVGTDRGITYAVMELLEGQTLRDLLAAGPLPLKKAIHYGAQIASALDAAHDRNIVHRDLKPENLFIVRGNQIKVLDFGLAVRRQGSQSPFDVTQTATGTTHPGAVLGTPGYMSPEQVRGEPADPRSDIFALGCVLYEMLSGERAFRGDSSIDTLHATLRNKPRNLSAFKVPASLTCVVARCLEKAPGERFQSARDVAFALDAAAIAGSDELPAAGRSPSFVSRHLQFTMVCALVAMVATVGWSFWRSRTA